MDANWSTKVENCLLRIVFTRLDYLSVKQKGTMPQVKKRTVETIDFVIDNERGTEVETHAYRSEHVTFNDKGDVLTEESWDFQGQLNERYTREYDGEGRLSKVCLHQDGIGVAEERELEYGDNQKLVGEILKYQDGSISKTTYNYDDSGNRTSVLCQDEDGEEEFREEMEYDKDGNRLGHKRYDYGELSWAKGWEYDGDGNVVKTMETDEHGDSVERNYTIGKEGEILEEREYREGKLVAVRQQSFDKNGNIVRILNEDTGSFEKVVFSYDQAGNQVLQEGFNREGEKLHRVEREYDEHNNVKETRVWMFDLVSGLTRRYSLRYQYEYAEGA